MIRLPVNGAFHSSLMSPAVVPFKKALRNLEIEDPVIAIYSNVDGKRYRTAEQIRNYLPKQVYISDNFETINSSSIVFRLLNQ